MSTTKNKMIVCLLLDESGSMRSQKNAALAGINEYIETMRSDYKTKPELGEIYLSFVTFSSNYTNLDNQVRFVHNLRNIEEVENIPDSAYNPSGGTPLLRAIGKTIESLDNMDEVDADATNPLTAFLSNKDIENAKIVVVVQTDGQETEHSEEYSKEVISKMIKEREAKGNWTFVFLGAGIDAVSEGMKFGVSAASSYSFTKDAESLVGTYSAAGAVTSSLRSSASMNSTTYVADMKSIIDSGGEVSNCVTNESNKKK